MFKKTFHESKLIDVPLGAYFQLSSDVRDQHFWQMELIEEEEFTFSYPKDSFGWSPKRDGLVASQIYGMTINKNTKVYWWRPIVALCVNCGEELFEVDYLCDKCLTLDK